MRAQVSLEHSLDRLIDVFQTAPSMSDLQSFQTGHLSLICNLVGKDDEEFVLLVVEWGVIGADTSNGR